MDKLKIVVLASGRGSNLQAIIDAISEGRIKGEIILVISDKKDAYALKRAEAAGIKSLYIPKTDYKDRVAYDKAMAEIIKQIGADLIVLAGFMRILSQVFIDYFPDRIINIHPSLLPAFPGLHAQEQAFNHGVKISGCTVHFVDGGLDSGPIIAQQAVPVLDNDTPESLADRILVEEHKLYPEVISDIAKGKIKVTGRKTVRS